MKRRVLLGALAWTLFITLLHIQLNVGWSKLKHEALVLTGAERQQLMVGFLPVT